LSSSTYPTGEARLEAGGVEKDVGLLETDEGNDAVDAD
jgi:hypothetical protein